MHQSLLVVCSSDISTRVPGMHVPDDIMAEDRDPRQAHLHSTCDLRELISSPEGK